ncbi:ABC transporter substrate-binding protein [Rhodococcus sp. NPDC127530]|uniref:ABC transporter substrate-binding protein n=1 Tax=unclassified Rhodococcus (in: high G+C Gram-positive bacteria) TaxID=192944 RepID=UPI00362DF4EE
MYSTDSTSFDPDRITATHSLMYLFPLYDTLVRINAEGEPEPMLARSWTVAEDSKSLDMNLIDGYTYHDGAPFDAQSVVANIERHRAPGTYNTRALDIVDSVEAVDSNTVRFNVSRGAGALIGILGGSAGMMMSPLVMDDENQSFAPTGGSGAYRISNYLSGSRVEYTAVDNYWDPSSQGAREMDFIISGDDNARLNAITTEAADATFIRDNMYDATVKAGLVTCQDDGGVTSWNISLNTQLSHFGDKRVREAINYAIDRVALGAVQNNFCKPASQLFPESYFASSKNITPESYGYNPDKARELLAEAGLADGFDFELEVMNQGSTYLGAAEVVQANLADVGINMRVQPVDPGTLAEDFSVNKTAEAVLSSQQGESDPSVTTGKFYLPNGFNNPGGWGTDRITELHQQAMDLVSTEDRAAAYTELMDTVHEEVAPQITLCHPIGVFAMNDRVKGVEIYALGNRLFRGVGVTPSTN